VPEWIRHNFFFKNCQIFEILFNVCAKILIKPKVEVSGLNSRPSSIATVWTH
jgi:hypothetical protein